MQSTIKVLSENGIRHVGAGNNIHEARLPLILNGQGIRVGVYACCEKEFSFATETAAGANVFDPLQSFDDIADLEGKCDYLIVLFHGGMQGYPYPTPYQQKVCRKMCEKGADLVVCQHSHIIGCEETYAGGRIVYGQGNFLLDDMDSESWQAGLITEVTIGKEDKSVSYIPVQTRNHKTILHPDPKEVMSAFTERSDKIKNDGAVERMFSDLCDEKLSDYLMKLAGKSSLMQRVSGRLGITKHYRKLYSMEACYLILDYLYCDAHREAIEYGLNQLINNKMNNKSKQ